MTQKRRAPLTICLLLGCSLLYFVLLIFPNFTGAQNEDMIAIFEVDEYAQYAHAVRMASGGETLPAALRNFFAYQHYFYGFPFYFFSGLSLLPLRWFLGAEWSQHTPVIMLVLRQMASVLPNLLSVWLLTYAATEFKSTFKTLTLFLLMLLLPGLLSNSLWWHPDGLGLLFMALVFFFLRLDRLRYGRFFWLAAAAAGVGLGIKFIGGFFAFTIPSYLLIGIYKQKLTWPQAAQRGVGFVAVMLAALVLSNPLLLLPQERAEIISTQRIILTEASQGIFVSRSAFLQDGALPQWLIDNFGGTAFLLLLLVALVAGLLQKQFRLQALLLCMWLLPNLLAVMSASASRAHYWLPIMMPAFTAFTFILPVQWSDLTKRPVKPRALLQWAAIVLLAVQAVGFVHQDSKLYTQALHKEEHSASLQFYRTVQPLVAALPQAEMVIYRDWKVYFPAEAGLSVFMDWELGSHELLAAEQPDVLLLERENVQTYGSADYLSIAPDPERLETMHRFYRNALLHQLDGYRLLYEDSFGLVFVRE